MSELIQQQKSKETLLTLRSGVIPPVFITKRAPIGAYKKSSYQGSHKELLSELKSSYQSLQKSKETQLTLRSGVIPPASSAFFPQPTGVVSWPTYSSLASEALTIDYFQHFSHGGGFLSKTLTVGDRKA